MCRWAVFLFFFMIKIGLTGGIGTGKTFISKVFAKQGIPVFYADDEAKKLYSDAAVLSEIRNLFGDIIFENGKLVFAKLAEIVFSKPEEMEKLEKILHPKVMEKFEQWAEQQDTECVMMESAILFEAHLERYFDRVIVVNASLPVRMARIRRRNPELSDEEILARIGKQMDQAEKCLLADEVIEHDEDW